MPVILNTTHRNSASTLVPDRQARQRTPFDPSNPTARRLPAPPLGALLPRSRSAPDLGDVSSPRSQAPRHRTGLPRMTQGENSRQAASDTATTGDSPGSRGVLVKRSASALEIDPSAFPPSAAVMPNASPASSIATSTTFDRSGDLVEYFEGDGLPLHSQVIDFEPPGTDPRARRQTLCAFSGPAINAAAAALSLMASRLSAHPVAAKISAAASGALWVGGAVASELGNAPYSTWVSGANSFGGTAGALGIAAPLAFGQTQRDVAYGSAAAWAANGAADIVRAVGNDKRNLAGRLLQGVSGTANMAAAGLAAGAADASAHHQGVKAAHLGTVSSALWAVGAATALGSEWVARSEAFNRPPRPPNPELDSPV